LNTGQLDSTVCVVGRIHYTIRRCERQAANAYTVHDRRNVVSGNIGGSTAKPLQCDNGMLHIKRVPRPATSLSR